MKNNDERLTSKTEMRERKTKGESERLRKAETDSTERQREMKERKNNQTNKWHKGKRP